MKIIYTHYKSIYLYTKPSMKPYTIRRDITSMYICEVVNFTK